MNGEPAEVAIYLLLLLLPLAALVAQRPPLGRAVKMVFAWIAIFAVGLLLVGNRDRLPFFAAFDSDRRTTGRETRIAQSPDGHFWADARINGIARRMLVDSGASTTALSVDTARAIGLNTDESPFPTVVQTANGTIIARVATVKSLAIGSVIASDLGVIISPAFGDTDVIGMNFLSRLASWRVEGNVLTLTPATSREFT